MHQRKKLLWAALLLAALLWRMLFPGGAPALRDWAEAVFWPGGRETVAAWGRALAEEERLAALQPGVGP